MRRKIRFGFSTTLFLFILIFVCSSTVLAHDKEYRLYYIDFYDINVTVNEDHTFDITETIKLSNSCYADMLEKKILLKNSMSRFGFTDLETKGKISNISVNGDFSVDFKDIGNAVIAVNKNSHTKINGKTYKITYRYENMSSNVKEMFLNLINADPDDEQMYVKKLKFSITMPKAFDPKEFFVYKGKSKVDFSVKGNIITGQIDDFDFLDSEDSLDIYARLADGYFVNRKYVEFDVIFWVQVFLPIICLLISCFVYLKYGRNPKINIKRNFYPPLDINSAQVDLMYRDGSTRPCSLNSLFIYFANKGFLKIRSYNKRKRKIDCKATKAYTGDESWESIFFNKFFYTTEKLKEKEKQKRIKKEEKNVREKIFEKSARKKDIIMLSLLSFMILVFLESFVLLICMYIGVFYAFAMLGVGAFSILLTFFLLTSIKESFSNRIVSGFVAGMAIIVGSYFSVLLNSRWIGVTILTSACVITMVVIFALPGKRTPYGLKMREDIKGFKNFIKTATEQEMRQLIISDPDYLYKILPHMYALHMPKKYMKKFKSIKVKKPDWYTGKIDFDLNVYSATKFTYNVMDVLIPITIVIPIPIPFSFG